MTRQPIVRGNVILWTKSIYVDCYHDCYTYVITPGLIRIQEKRLLAPARLLVDETVWNAIADKRKKELARINQNNATEKFYLLRDLLECGECGSNMFGRIHTARRTQIYYCPKKT